MSQKPRGDFNLEVTLEKAVKELAASDPEAVAHRSKTSFNQESKVFQIKFLQTEYHIHFPTGKIRVPQSEERVPLPVHILLLHYLNSATGVPLSGNWISFKELPGGQIYVGPFENRAVKPFIKTFAPRPKNFIAAAKKLGGTEAEFGDISMTIPALPRVPITFVLWEADEEFPPSATVLYDAHAHAYLPTEDYALLPSLVIEKMAKLVPPL